MADSNKTEKATPKKRRDERNKGHVFLSQDVVSVATIVGAFAMLMIFGGRIASEAGDFMSHCIALCHDNTLGITGVVSELARQGVLVVVRTVLPMVLVVAAAAVVVTFAQTRMLVATELIKPKFSKINPIEGFKRLFSLRSVIEALKGIMKIAVLIVVIYISLQGVIDESAKYFYTDIRSACAHLFDVAIAMIARVIIAFVALAAVDFFYQRWSFERDMRMTKEEVKEEYKQTEGDPKIKSRIKEKQRAMSMARMMQQVPKADVVIRNPSHYAVALRYKPEQDNAPIVLAKGQDELALRIVKVAEEAGVAVMENVPLARALYAQTEVDHEIPIELYGAVAEVLVYIFKLDEKKKIVK